MMQKHYLEFRLTGADDAPFWLAHCFRRIHGFIEANANENLGVSFPEINTQSPGAMIRVFGNKEPLSALLDSPGIQDLIRKHLVYPLEVKSVPDECGFAIYRRSRSQERLTDHALKKRSKRYLDHLVKKGIKVTDAEMEDRIARWKKSSSDKCPHLNLKSNSNDRRFKLFIKREVADRGSSGRFSGYGLALDTATVPEF